MKADTLVNHIKKVLGVTTLLVGGMMSGSNLQAQTTPTTLIDVAFGAGTNTTKTGFAATGISSTDLWNFYTRDDGYGGYLYSGSLGPLQFSDGTYSGAGLTINNAPGAWGNGTSDPMYQQYLYPFDGGDITITLTNLDVGQYDIYLYGHAPSTDGNSTYQLTVDNADYGKKSTTTTSGWNSVSWSDGMQYVVFRQVNVFDTNQTTTITVSPQASSYAIISGLQIAKMVRSNALISVDFGEGTNTTKTGFAATGETTSDFWNFYTRDDGHGGYKNLGLIYPLRYVDHTSTVTAGLIISNAAGAWGNGTSDPMYAGYLYPYPTTGNISVVVSNLTAGQYDFYIYGHAVSNDGNSKYNLKVGTTDYGDKLTTTTSGWNSVNWQEGMQYVLFRDVDVSDPLKLVTITVSPDASPYAILSGLQILKRVSTNSYIDVDFGVGTNTTKTGFAATGTTTTDFWNFYTRDDGFGGYKSFGVLSPLLLVNQTATPTGLTISNAAGEWGNGTSDPMYYSYLYPYPTTGNVVVTLTNLVAGQYDVYVYGHAVADDGNSNYELSVDYTYGTQATTTTSGWNSVNWQEGMQYVRFRGVNISSGSQTMTLTVSPDASPYAVISGMQLVRLR
jgi:hypothetical protein